MTSISSIETITPQSVTSQSDTPSTSRARRQQTYLDNSEPANSKGKQREVDLGGYDDLRDDGHESVQSPDNSLYPPVNDDRGETRRVEETLKRWETAERQRRKAERDSVRNSTSPSFVENVSRRASLLWSGKRSRHENNTSLGNHVALQSQENINAVPLDDFNATPTPSPSPSPPPGDSADSRNPFANPPEEPVSPFADPHQRTVVMSPSTDSPTSNLLSSQSSLDPKRPALLTASSSFNRAPPGPPMPLGLPPPRTPPPPIDAPPRATSPPSPRSTGTRNEPTETRWWHDWLCGCSEGPDRGGDYQAGRTNPFE